MLASLMVVLVSVAVFFEMYASTNRRIDVLIVTQTVEQGQQIQASDLGQVSVSISSGVTPIPVPDAGQLVGNRAAVTIPAGSLLTPGDVSGAQPITAGYAVVGMALKAGQLPAAGVSPGDQVMVVQTASAGASPVPSSGSGAPSVDTGASAGVLVPLAKVFDVEVPPANTGSSASQLVSVEVSSSLAAAVSTAAAADQVSLVLLPSGTAGPPINPSDPSVGRAARPLPKGEG